MLSQKNFIKLVFSFFLAVCFIMPVTGTSLQAKELKPSAPKSLELCPGVTESFPIELNGWTLDSVKVKSSKPSIAYAEAAWDTILVTGKSEGKATITTSIKAKKGKKTKTFKLKTKVNVVSDIPLISFEDLLKANSHDAVFAKHSSFTNSQVIHGEVAAKYTGFWKYTQYCVPDKIYESSVVYDSNALNYALDKRGYYTETNEFYKEYGNNPVIFFKWYAMTEAEERKLREEAWRLPSTSAPMNTYDDNDEHTIHVSRMDNELIITTQMTIPFNAVFNSSLIETVYRVNVASLELRKADAYFVNDHDRKHYISQYVEYDKVMPFIMDDVIAFADKYMSGVFENPYTVSIAYDDEESYSVTCDKSEPYEVSYRMGYNLYYDKEGKELVDYIPSGEDITVYALRTELEYDERFQYNKGIRITDADRAKFAKIEEDSSIFEYIKKDWEIACLQD